MNAHDEDPEAITDQLRDPSVMEQDIGTVITKRDPLAAKRVWYIRSSTLSKIVV